VARNPYDPPPKKKKPRRNPYDPPPMKGEKPRENPYDRFIATKPAREAKAKRTRATRDPAKVAEMERARTQEPTIRLEVFVTPKKKKKK
jgi:hypothetical protein